MVIVGLISQLDALAPSPFLSRYVIYLYVPDGLQLLGGALHLPDGLEHLHRHARLKVVHHVLAD